MKVRIKPETASNVRRLIMETKLDGLTDHETKTLGYCLYFAEHIWAGWHEDKLACVWGLVPPTLMSDTAFLWLYHTDAIKTHEFTFVRYSQRMIEDLLKLYPIITGIADPADAASIRWLKWLGAKFGQPEGLYVPFTIRKK